MSAAGTTPVGATQLPRAALWGAGLLVGASLLLVAVARLTGYSPAQPPPSAVVGQVSLRFEDRADGAVWLYRAGESEPVEELPPSSHQFVRGVMRGLARERRARDLSDRDAFTLTRWADGRLSLDDPATGRHIDLEVFGPDNAGSFAEIYRQTVRENAHDG